MYGKESMGDEDLKAAWLRELKRRFIRRPFDYDRVIPLPSSSYALLRP